MTPFFGVGPSLKNLRIPSGVESPLGSLRIVTHFRTFPFFFFPLTLSSPFFLPPLDLVSESSGFLSTLTSPSLAGVKSGSSARETKPCSFPYSPPLPNNGVFSGGWERRLLLFASNLITYGRHVQTPEGAASLETTSGAIQLFFSSRRRIPSPFSRPDRVRDFPWPGFRPPFFREGCGTWRRVSLPLCDGGAFSFFLVLKTFFFLFHPDQARALSPFSFSFREALLP